MATSPAREDAYSSPTAHRVGNLMVLGALIREARARKGWTQTELAQTAGVSRTWLVSIEQGRHARAEIGKVLSVIRALDAQLLMSLQDSDDSSREPQPGDSTLHVDLDKMLGSPSW